MTATLPPLDLHAHIKPTIPSRDLEALGAVVFVATRSLEEFATTVQRRDAVSLWGVGCHPGVVPAQDAFDPRRFAELARSTAFVSEVGLDGRSKVPMDQQEQTFSAILKELAIHPRIASIHSSGAIDRVLDALEASPIQGAVLHWWRGTAAQTDRALNLGCWFSVNASGVARPGDVRRIPFDRILTETDHPSGDRTSAVPRRPGAVATVESALGSIYGVSAADVRSQVWRNLEGLVSQVDVETMFPDPVRRMLRAVKNGS